MGLLKTYSANNFVLTEDYSVRFNQVDCGVPEVSVELDEETHQPQVVIAQWCRAIMEERAGFKYIGMNYSTAQSCANAMRSALTIISYPWAFGEYIENGVLLYGWHKGTGTPTIESEVRLEKTAGCMYDVVVNAKCTTINYDKNHNALDLTQKPLYSVVSGFAGWTQTHILKGKNFIAPSADNFSLIVAPTRNVSFELVAENLITSDPTSITGFTIDNWYKATTDQYAQVKYEGMTKTACRNLFSSLNNTSGWYFQFHPWEYRWDVQTKTLGWQPSAVTQYQCLNDFKATEDESGLFTAELTLHVQQETMTKNPQSFTPPAYPSFWSTKIPGLHNYL